MPTTCSPSRQRCEHKSGLVDGSEPVGADDQRDGVETQDHLTGTESLPEGTQDATGALNEQFRSGPRGATKKCEGLPESDPASFLPRCEARCERVREMPGVDRIQVESPLLGLLDQFGIRPVSRAEWFDRHKSISLPFQVIGQQEGEEGLSDLRIGACDEPDAGRHDQ